MDAGARRARLRVVPTFTLRLQSSHHMLAILRRSTSDLDLPIRLSSTAASYLPSTSPYSTQQDSPISRHQQGNTGWYIHHGPPLRHLPRPDLEVQMPYLHPPLLLSRLLQIPHSHPHHIRSSRLLLQTPITVTTPRSTRHYEPHPQNRLQRFRKRPGAQTPAQPLSPPATPATSYLRSDA